MLVYFLKIDYKKKPILTRIGNLFEVRRVL